MLQFSLCDFDLRHYHLKIHLQGYNCSNFCNSEIERIILNTHQWSIVYLVHQWWDWSGCLVIQKHVLFILFSKDSNWWQSVWGYGGCESESFLFILNNSILGNLIFIMISYCFYNWILHVSLLKTHTQSIGVTWMTVTVVLKILCDEFSANRPMFYWLLYLQHSEFQYFVAY